MKKLLTTISVVCLGMFLFTGTASAVPPHGKSTILHCGCNDDGTALIYKEISVSSKARGHLNHLAQSATSCGTGVFEDEVEITKDFVRAGDDCQVGGKSIGDAMEMCVDFDTVPDAGDVCGMEFVE